MQNFKVQEIAQLIEAEVIGNQEFIISGLNRIENAKSGELTFFYNDKYRKYLETTNASVIIVPANCDYLPKENQTLLRVSEPYQKFVQILIWLNNQKARKSSFIHHSAVIGNSCEIDETAYIGANCVIGNNCKIGKNTVLHSNISIYDNSKIGDNCTIHSNATIYEDTEIGNNCVIHSGVALGSDGFGFFENKDGSYTKIPQLGNVVLENDIEIGANTTIDRALVGSTIIRNGVKLDNQIQIAHNCEIGENSAMAAQVGVSGSVKVGKRNRFGGQSGISGHIEIADDVVLLAKSGVPKSIEKGGLYFGSPIREKMQAFRIEAVIHNLPDLAKDVKLIKKKLEIENNK